MLFNSLGFLIFFPVVVLCFYLIPVKWRNYWLLPASIYFYMCWDARYVVLLLGCIVVTYSFAILLPKSKRKRLWAICCLAVNFGVLFFFKYYNFAVDSIGWAIRHISSADGQLFHHNLLLPIGVSFYTFQASSYFIDVYREKIQPEHNIFKFALYISFFPQLVAGPIERSEKLLPQFDELHYFDQMKVKHGLELMLWGFFEKLVIADRVSIFVNEIYEHYEAYGFFEIALATIGFAIQIYCDFGGYSHIAIGAAEVMGFKLSDNFRQPYFAASIKEFWKRWHISLSNWLKDYLYIPLGGNRKGKLITYRNLLITFLASGIWHGDSWSFVVWGGLHGIVQVLEDVSKPILSKLAEITKINTRNLSFKLLRIFATFIFTSFAWLFFRASGMSQALSMIKQAAKVFNPWILFDKTLLLHGLSATNLVILVMATFLLLLVDLLHEKGVRIRSKIDEQGAVARIIIYYLGVMTILIFGIFGPNYDASRFIYFQF